MHNTPPEHRNSVLHLPHGAAPQPTAGEWKTGRSRPTISFILPGRFQICKQLAVMGRPTPDLHGEESNRRPWLFSPKTQIRPQTRAAWLTPPAPICFEQHPHLQISVQSVSNCSKDRTHPRSNGQHSPPPDASRKGVPFQPNPLHTSHQIQQ
ncbi:hypothetical protein ACLOJK_038375 [Asimina triloba]